MAENDVNTTEDDHYDRFESVEDLARFFEEIDARRGTSIEPDWEEHKRVIEESKLRGLRRVD